jgi:hypothetical protein
MKKFIFFAMIVGTFSLNAFAQNDSTSKTERLLPDGTPSDNCTGFPDGNYADCCFEHDLAYFKGGSWKERWRADKKLYKCVNAKGGAKNKFVAPIMWLGVRAFGPSWVPTPARWGFGKNRMPKSDTKVEPAKSEK